MSTLAPKPKDNEIVKRLNEMSKLGIRNDVELKRMELEAEKLKKTDMASAFNILGIICCMKGDIGNMHSHHRNAINYSNEESFYLAQYAISLSKSSLLVEAFQFMQKAYEKDQTELRVIDELIKLASKLSLEDEFNYYISKYEKLTCKEYPGLSFSEDDDERLSQMLDGFDVLIHEHPHLVVEANPDLIKLADDLVKGVEVD